MPWKRINKPRANCNANVLQKLCVDDILGSSIMFIQKRSRGGCWHRSCVLRAEIFLRSLNAVCSSGSLRSQLEITRQCITGLLLLMQSQHREVEKQKRVNNGVCECIIGVRVLACCLKCPASAPTPRCGYKPCIFQACNDVNHSIIRGYTAFLVVLDISLLNFVQPPSLYRIMLPALSACSSSNEVYVQYAFSALLHAICSMEHRHQDHEPPS